MTSPYLNIIKKMRTAKELFAELNSFDENRRIEAKSASAVGKSMMETVCAFANEPGLCGGYLLLGAKRTGMAEDGRPVYEPENIEEERRLAYVAITRAKKKLYISSASTRMLYGMTNRNRPSRSTNTVIARLIDTPSSIETLFQRPLSTSFVVRFITSHQSQRDRSREPTSFPNTAHPQLIRLT